MAGFVQSSTVVVSGGSSGKARGLRIPRVIASIAAMVALVLSGFTLGQPAPAAALTPGVAFSADDLPTWQTNGVVRALAASHGQVVAVGEFTQIRPGAGQSGTARNVTGLAIFDAATGQPSTCQLPAALSGGTARLYTAEASPDGETVFVGGNFTTIGGVARTRLAEIDLQTCSVTSFSVSGVSSFVYSLEITNDAVYFGGLFQTISGQERRSFAKVNRAGVLDAGWIANAVGNMEVRPEPGIECRTTADANSRGTAIEVSPDGSQVVLGGPFYTVNGTSTHSIAVVDALTGAVVRGYPSDPNNWGNGSNVIHPCSFTKAIETDGSYFYIGNEGSGGGVFDGTARFSWSTHNQDWRDTCLGAVQALLVKGGFLYQAHHHHDCSSTGQYPDGRRIFLSTTAVDDPTQQQVGWFPTLNDGTGEGIGGRALVTATVNGVEYLWVGGEFTRVNGAAQQGLTRFSPTDTGNPAAPQVVVQAVTSGAIQITTRSVYDPDDGPLNYILYRNNVQVGEPVSATSNWWTRPQVTFVDTDVTPGTSYQYRVRAVDAAGNESALSALRTGVATDAGSAYAAAVIGDEPSLYWRYDDSGAWVIDSSGAGGTGKNGIAQNGVTYAGGALPGDASSSASFDGTGQYVWNDQIAYGPSAFSIETWFKTPSTSGGVLVSYGNGRPRTDNGNDTSSSNYDRLVYMDASGRVRFGVYSGGVQSVRSGLAYNDDQWHHLVATQGASGMRLYIDGVEVGSNGATTNQAYFGTWRVGGENLSGWPDNGGNTVASRSYDGLLDETAIYERPLTHAQAIAHFQAGGGEIDVNDAPTDAYGAAVYGDNPSMYWRLDETSGSTALDASLIGARDGTVGSGVTRVSGGVSDSGAVQMPGSNTAGSGVVSTTQVSAPGAYSLEFWLNTTTTAGGKIIGFENTATETGNSYDKHVYMLNDGRLRFGVYTGSSQTIASTQPINDGQWHHVVATQGSSGMRLYVDGNLVGQGPVTNSETGDGFWRIGGGNLGSWPDQPSSNYFAGRLDEVAVYPVALTQELVDNHYVIALNDTTAPTVPAGLTHVGTSTAQLSWTASTDANGVAGYRVHRGDTADFTASAATLVGDVTAATWTDPDEQPGTRYYRVTAYDAAGNESAASAVLTVALDDVNTPSVPTALAASVAGTDVMLSWNTSTDDVGVDHYVVYRGTTASFDVATAQEVGQTSTAGYTDLGVDEGTWHYRVVAVDAAGNVSAPSTSASAVVDIDTDAPQTPGGLATTVAPSGVATLTWTAATDDVGVVGYRLYRGATADFVANAASLVADGVTALSWSDPDTTIGQRFYRVAAYDAATNQSPASAAVAATVADGVSPSTPAGVGTVVTGSDVQLAWTASTDNIGVDGYLVYRGSTAGFPIAGLTPAEVLTTDYTDEGLADGTYHYRVVAVDAAGNASAPSSSVAAVVDTSDPVEPVEPVTLTAPAVADTMVAQAAPTTLYGTTTQLSSRSPASGSTIESYLRFEIPAAPEGLQLTGASIRLTTSNDATAHSAGAHQVSLLDADWSEASTRWNNRPTTGFGAQLGEVTGAVALNTTYDTALDAAALRPLTGTTVSVALTSTSTDNLRLVSREGAGANRRPVLVLDYTPVSNPDPDPDPDPEPDTTAPSVPTSVTGTGTAAGVTSLAWSASTDNVGVVGYAIYRGATASFVADSASQVGTATALTFSQSGVAAGTWYYRVAAVDAAENLGAASGAVAIVVPVATVEPVTVTAPVTADAMVAQAAAGTNYGTANYLSTRTGGTSALVSYLSFEVPEAPAGGVLTSAVLRLRTTSASGSDSAETHDVRLITDGWSEATITWANRPTTAGESVGTVTGFSGINAALPPTTLDAAAIGTQGGSTVTLVLSAAGSDNLRLWSKESTTAGYRPVLELTYSFE